MAGFKIPKFPVPTLKPHAAPKTGSSQATSAPSGSHSTNGAKGTDALGAFKAQLPHMNINPNRPALPETAVKTQKFGGWVG